MPSAENTACVPALVSVAPTPAVPLLYVAFRFAVVAHTQGACGTIPEATLSTYCLVAACRFAVGSAARTRGPVSVPPDSAKYVAAKLVQTGFVPFDTNPNPFEPIPSRVGVPDAPP